MTETHADKFYDLLAAAFSREGIKYLARTIANRRNLWLYRPATIKREAMLTNYVAVLADEGSSHMTLEQTGLAFSTDDEAKAQAHKWALDALRSLDRTKGRLSVHREGEVEPFHRELVERAP
jgi:hypothetical protein